ncbi:unnamed protein product [Caenorhabditis bovis]|uniref:A4_EXTRA domain-containing protein n=1 Tax=Caenorhabditis bovis TaxID=2654633 RepID=A0A8S1EMH2_9PELO|nr:unnamed protein product [Caenorhabditis bovis]
MTVGKLLIGLLIPLVVATTYVESAAANSGLTKRHEKFVPMVAFSCGYRNQYLGEDGTWKSDDRRYATCFTGKLDILKYCKTAYPSLNITNIVEYSHEVSIDKWCREEGNPCKWTHSVRPYQCIDGEFHSEALQVPHDCQFSHVNSLEQCYDYQHWKNEASKQCAAKRSKDDKSMIVRSFSVLEPCALDMFTGVEFVCCPNEATKESKEVGSIEDVELNEDDDDDDITDYYEEDDDGEKDEDDEAQDPYFKAADWSHEHDDFKKAEERLDERHRKKVDKVMKEWGQLESRYAAMKKDDPKGADKFKLNMSNRFQKTVSSLEEEHKKMKKEIEAVHEERVQALLNEKKRDATHNYRQALATHLNKPNKHNVLNNLKIYIRSEEKDRMHTLNRYRHLLRTDKAEAAAFRPTVLHRLRYIDLRINGTLAMLHDFPDLQKYVRPIALAYWQDYRRENTPELSDKEILGMNSLDPDAKNKKLVDLYAEAYLKLHPTDILDVKAPSTTVDPLSPNEVVDVKVLPTESSVSEEDDDEYYEDEDDEQVHKSEKVKVIDIKPKEEKKIVDSPKLVETSVQTEDADDDDDDDDDSSSSSSDSEEDRNIKELHVDIEPIIEDPPSFYRKEKLVQNEITRTETVMSSANVVFFVLSVIVFSIISLLIMVARRRRAMRGFIEVDVYTPEERHVAGMQVNGYENPTYSFFDSKA